jgi:cell division protein FtsZ
MSLNLKMPREMSEMKPKIIVFGVGGAGGNAVNNMIRSNLEGVDCVVANTDAQALAQSLCERRIQLGLNITQGLGAGSRPEIGRAAAEEGMDEIIAQLEGCHMAFITAGMGGGTGTGAAPVISRLAREHGVLTVGVVTKPFHFEGSHRMRVAEAGIDELQQYVDTLIVIPNQNLFRVANERTTFADAFKMADDVLYSGVRGVTDLMVMPGLINLDFADIRTVMSEMGSAMMGAGEAEGDERSVKAAEAAISNPLLDDVSLKGARGVLINITGGPDMTLYEVDEAANRIRDEVDPNANIIFGSTFDEALQGKIRVSIFATGISRDAQAAPQPVRIKVVSDQGAPRKAEPASAQAEPETEEPAPAEPTAATAVESVQAAAPAVEPAPVQPMAQRAAQAAPAPRPIEPSFAAARERAEARPVEQPAPEPMRAEPAKPATKSESLFRKVAPRPGLLSLLGERREESRSARGAERTPPSLVREEKSVTIKVTGAPSAAEKPARPAAAPAQPVSRAERDEADLLEIPAFLRRQAN